MKINILSEENKTLLSRIEINAEIEFEGKTPSKEEVRKEISKLKKKNEELIIVKNIYTKFGLNKAKSLIYIYKNKKEMERIEPKLKKEEKKEESKEEKKEEKKVEKPKQENGKGKGKEEKDK